MGRVPAFLAVESPGCPRMAQTKTGRPDLQPELAAESVDCPLLILIFHGLAIFLWHIEWNLQDSTLAQVGKERLLNGDIR